MIMQELGRFGIAYLPPLADELKLLRKNKRFGPVRQFLKNLTGFAT